MTEEKLKTSPQTEEFSDDDLNDEVVESTNDVDESEDMHDDDNDSLGYVRRTYNQIIIDVTENFIDKKLHRFLDKPNKYREIESELLFELNTLIVTQNTYSKETNELNPMLPTHTTLPSLTIAMLIVELEHVYKLEVGGEASDPDKQELGIYIKDGPETGTYMMSVDAIHALIRLYNPTIKKHALDDTVLQIRSLVSSRRRTIDPDLIAVNNGIFNYKSKELLPFDPKYIFMSKSKVDYKENPENPKIYHEGDDYWWDVNTWVEELSDDPEIVASLWEILSAIVRPNVSWDKTAWLYSEDGNNGKGTIVSLMQNLCGPGSYASIPLDKFDEKYELEPLLRSNAILVDENDVGTYIDKAANLKAVITNDILPITRKYKSTVQYQFFGFMVQCLNEFPKAKDRSESFYRRQLFLPMTKRFEGRAKKYIKREYLKRQDVLEYVLNKVLNTDFYELSEPEASNEIMQQYKESNDPVRQFINEITPELEWDLVPYQFLYDLYCPWLKRNNSASKAVGRNTFIKDVNKIIVGYQKGEEMVAANEWFKINAGKSAIRSAGKMDAYEPLIIEYNVKEWQNLEYTGTTAHKKADFERKREYRGLVRCKNKPLMMVDDVPIEAIDESNIMTGNNNTLANE